MINENDPVTEAAMAQAYREQQQQAILMQQQQEQAALAQQEQQRAQELRAQQEQQARQQYRQPDSTGGYQPQQQEAPLFGLFGGGQPTYSNQALEAYRAQQQKEIDDSAYRQAMMTNEQRATYMLSRGGSMLAGALGSYMGGRDPAEERLKQVAAAQQGQDLSTSAGLRRAAQGIQDPVTRSQYLQAAQAAEDKELARTSTRATATKTKALEDALQEAKTVEEIDAAYLKHGDGAQRRDVLKAARTNEKEASAQKNFSVFYSKKYPDATPEEVAAIASDPELRKAVADPTKSMFEHIKTKNGYVIYSKKTGLPVNGGSVKGGFSSGSGLIGAGDAGDGEEDGGGAGGGKATGAVIGQGPAGEQVFRTKGGQLYVYGSDGAAIAYKGELLPKGGAVKITEDQAKAGNWVAQMQLGRKQVNEVLAKDPSVLKMPKGEYVAGLIPVVGEDVANTTRSPNRQRFVVAMRSIADGALRAATGAGVNRQEADQKIRELTPQVGDDVETINDKLDRMNMYIEAVTARAGAAAPKGAPDAPKLKVGTVKDGYRYMGGEPSSPNSWKPLSAPKGGAR